MSNEDFAKDPHTPPEALAMLSTSPSDTVRLLVAANPSTPVSALRHLALDSEKAVREAVSRNPRTPYDAFTAVEPPPPSQIGPVGQPTAEASAAATAGNVTTENTTFPPAPHQIPGVQEGGAVQAAPAQAGSPVTDSPVTDSPTVTPAAPTQTGEPKKSLWQRFLAIFGLG